MSRSTCSTPPPPTTADSTLVGRGYSAETRAGASYQGDIVVDQLTALVPSAIEVPPAPTVRDPLVVQDGSVAGAPWMFAMMSDAQFVARDPDSDIVRNARRTLREIRATRPEFLVINGDLVDEASPEDFALAQRVLAEELNGELPYYYVPGNHERAAGTLDNFRAAFGATSRVVDHKGTRFLMFDSSGISLRASDWTQLRTLRRELDRAAADPGVESVVVVQHVPPQDPTPAKASQLSDRKEAAVIESWLGGFQASSGKGAAFLGAHVGTFHASRVDGVPYFVNGNSGKGPSTAPDQGGFTGWSLWDVDNAAAGDSGEPWIATEVRPHVDSLALDSPDVLRAGESAPVTASVVQGTRTVPVGYPVTADWSGSPNVHIGDEAGARPSHTAVFDPATDRLTALRASTITLAVTVNDVVRRATVRLEARRAA